MSLQLSGSRSIMVTQDGVNWSTVYVSADSSHRVGGCAYDGTRWLSVVMGGVGPLSYLLFYQSLDGAMSWQAVEGVSTPSTLMTHTGDFLYAGGSWVLSFIGGDLDQFRWG